MNKTIQTRISEQCWCKSCSAGNLLIYQETFLCWKSSNSIYSKRLSIFLQNIIFYMTSHTLYSFWSECRSFWVNIDIICGIIFTIHGAQPRHHNINIFHKLPVQTFMAFWSSNIHKITHQFLTNFHCHLVSCPSSNYNAIHETKQNKITDPRNKWQTLVHIHNKNEEEKLLFHSRCIRI